MSYRIRAPSIVAALVAAGLMIAAAVGIAVFTSGSSSRMFRTFPGAAVSLPVEPGVRQVNTSPLNLVPDVALWTGNELLLFGSSDDSVGASNVGLLFNPRDGLWREMAPPPFDLLLKGAIGVWTGDSAVIVAMECGPESRVLEEGDRELNRCVPGSFVAARYLLASNLWEGLPEPGLSRKSFGTEGFNGPVGDALGWEGKEARFLIGTRLVGYAVADGIWRVLPDPPGAETCMVVDRTVSYEPRGREFAPAGKNSSAPLLTVAGLAAWSLDEGGSSWGEPITIDLPTDLLQRVSFGCTVRGVFAFTPSTLEHIVQFDTDGQWRHLPKPPAELVTQPPPAGLSQPEGLKRPIINLDFPAWTGKEMLLVMPGASGTFPTADGRGERVVTLPAYAARLDIDAGVWRAAEPGPTDSSTQVWLDGYSLVARPAESGRGELYTYSPG